jgi:hypothetical protein
VVLPMVLMGPLICIRWFVGVVERTLLGSWGVFHRPFGDGDGGCDILSYRRSGRESGGRAGLESGAVRGAKGWAVHLFRYVASVGVDMDLGWGMGALGSAFGFFLSLPLVEVSFASPVCVFFRGHFVLVLGGGAYSRIFLSSWCYESQQSKGTSPKLPRSQGKSMGMSPL